MEKHDYFFVGNKYIHLIFRLVAIIFGAIIFKKGIDYNDEALKVIGAVTVMVDSITSIKNLILIRNENKKR